MKILILWPSGVVETSNGLPVVRRMIWERRCEDMNRGDLFVYEASLRVLRYDAMEEIPISLSSITDQLYEYYNSEFDVVVLRGSNYIRNDGGLGEWKGFFEKIRIPVLVFGVGAQVPDIAGEVRLSSDTVECLRIIADKSVGPIGVRGFHTAGILESVGITNVEVIGCPSIFRQAKRENSIDYSAQGLRKVNVTTHPYLGGLYTRSAGHSRNCQKVLMRKLRLSDLDVKYLTQGISAETKIAYDIDSESGIAELRSIGWFDKDDLDQENHFKANSVCFETADEYYQYSMQGDLNIGVRLHGNITALAMGQPAVFVTYDSRTSELADYFSIPSVNEDAIDDHFSVMDYLSSIDFDRFNSAFRTNFDRMASFLDKNNVTHNLSAM